MKKKELEKVRKALKEQSEGLKVIEDVCDHVICAGLDCGDPACIDLRIDKAIEMLSKEIESCLECGDRKECETWTCDKLPEQKNPSDDYTCRNSQCHAHSDCWLGCIAAYGGAKRTGNGGNNTNEGNNVFRRKWLFNCKGYQP